MISKNVYQFRFELSVFQMKLWLKPGRKGEMYTAVLTTVHFLFIILCWPPLKNINVRELTLIQLKVSFILVC